ncbi:MAG: CHAD domain-containing protein [Planctomycetes bacterium]|nr:CHAD domain-containing protein [Planctomycetota bacterium]
MADAFERLAVKTRAGMSVAQVHDLRVLTRRMRACVWIMLRVRERPVLRELRRALRRLGRVLGERRMFDVAREDAAAFKLDAAPLDAPRAYAGKMARERLKSWRRREITILAKRSARQLAGSPLSHAALGLAELDERLQAALREAPKGKAQQHRLRIEAKKTRYVLEIFGRKTDAIKDLQGRLGRAHDLEVLQEVLGPSPTAAIEEEKAWGKARRIMRKTVKIAAGELAACASLLKASTGKGPSAKR